MKLPILCLLFASAAAGETFTYWIEPCTRTEVECEAADEQLADWAFGSWQRASEGRLKFVKSPMSKARIRLFWAANGNQGLYGETRPITVDGLPGAEVDVRPALRSLGVKIENAGSTDRLFRHTVVYLTCLHEIGHALGLPHTRASADVMYSFEHGADVIAFFQRYRRKLKNREDIRSIPGLSTEDKRRLLNALRTGGSTSPSDGVVKTRSTSPAE